MAISIPESSQAGAPGTSAVAFIRDAVKQAKWWFDGTVADVTPEQAHWQPPGNAAPIAAVWAHLALSTDGIVHGVLQGKPPLFATEWSGRTGLSEPMPQPGTADWQDYLPWARRVRVDLPALRQYFDTVFAATDAYLASLTDADLRSPLDLSALGVGQVDRAWGLSILLLNHVGTETGEIAVLKGLQGLKGYPA